MDAKTFAGKYTVERELGVSGTGRTWLASDPEGEPVVVKVVRPVDSAAAEDLERDVSLISGIRNPGLPLIHEWGHDGRDFFLVREYVPGADLVLELGQQGLFAPVTAARYGVEIADALAQIHRRGLVHGNVKTANVIRTPEDEIKVVGNSLGLAAPKLAPDAPASSAQYLAPEQVEGGTLTPATDVYATGVVLYELVTGRVPFSGAAAGAVADQQVHAVPDPPSAIAEDVPPALDAVIMRALEKAPEARYADGDALRAALKAVFEPTPAVRASRGAGPRSPWPWVGVGVLVVAAVVALAWAMGLFGGGMVSVPNVAGMTQSQATAAISGAGLQVGTVTFSGGPVSGVADGSVSSQTPAQGTRVDPASKVDLVLAGANTVKVPNTVGQTETQAILNLEKAGLSAGTITNVATSSVGAGLVLSQTPAAGGTVARGSTVDLRVSQAAVAVPNVTNALQADARATLESAGFVVAVTRRSDATVASGHVIEQNPTGGVTAQPGATITIVVSSGPALVEVPDVVEMTQAEAVNALTAAGFTSRISFQTGGGPADTVVTQDPEAGVNAAAGSTVSLVVVQ